MAGTSSGPSEQHSLRGATDRGALIDVREVIAQEEPMASASLDDFLNPSQLVVTFDDGIGTASSSRIDVTWTVAGDYSFHYTDSNGTNVRWGRHPHDGDYGVTGLEHFHPPPDATGDPADVEQSCIRVREPELVARAVLKLWRAAYDRGTVSGINTGSNPP